MVKKSLATIVGTGLSLATLLNSNAERMTLRAEGPNNTSIMVIQHRDNASEGLDTIDIPNPVDSGNNRVDIYSKSYIDLSWNALPIGSLTTVTNVIEGINLTAPLNVNLRSSFINEEYEFGNKTLNLDIYNVTNDVAVFMGTYNARTITNGNAIPLVVNPGISQYVVFRPEIPNTIPTAGEVSITQPRGTNAVSFSLLVNDADTNDVLTGYVLNQASNGIALINGTNGIYTPNMDLPIADSLSYYVDDGNGGFATNNVIINLTNIPPVANDLYLSINKKDTFNGSIPVYLYPGNFITNSFVASGDGRLEMSGTNFTFNPNIIMGTNNYQVSVVDNYGDSYTNSVIINTTNRAPSLEDVVISGNKFDLMSGNAVAQDPDGDVRTIKIISGDTNKLSFNGLEYTFNPLSQAKSEVYSVVANDGIEDSTLASFVFTSTNAFPIANDSWSIGNKVDIRNGSFNTTDSDGSVTNTYAINSLPGIFNIDGTNWTWNPQGYIGSTNLTFYGVDNDGEFSSTNNVYFQSTNRTATLENLVIRGNKIDIMNGVVDKNDPDGDEIRLVVQTGDTNKLSVSGLSYSFNPFGLVAQEQYSVLLHDGFEYSGPAILEFNSTNRPPLVYNSNSSVVAGSTNNFSLDYHDDDGDNLTVMLQNAPAYGKLLSAPASNTVYFVDRNYFGSDSFSYIVSDGDGNSPANVNISVIPYNVDSRIDSYGKTNNSFSVSADIQPNRTHFLERTYDFISFESVDSKRAPYSTNNFNMEVFTDLNATNSNGFYRIRSANP